MGELDKQDISRKFPDHPISGRVKLALSWLPASLGRTLDAGCSYGYGTRFYLEKSKSVVGIDVDPDMINIANIKYDSVEFYNRSLESTGFETGIFDAVVLTDVLEHTENNIKVLNEIFRIMKTGGTLIITTPHKGLFQILDPYNYGYILKKHLPFMYKFIYKIVRFIKEGKFPKEYNPEHNAKHEHYSLDDFIRLLNSSDFKGHCVIEEYWRTGLVIEALALNLEVIFRWILPYKLTRILLKPLFALGDMDYKLHYGFLAYNIAIKVKKT